MYLNVKDIFVITGTMSITLSGGEKERPLVRWISLHCEKGMTFRNENIATDDENIGHSEKNITSGERNMLLTFLYNI